MAKMNWDRTRRENRAWVSATKDRRKILSRRMPPVQHGPCPQCGTDSWWDNSVPKLAGTMKRTAPDYRCVQCGHVIWPS